MPRVSSTGYCTDPEDRAIHLRGGVRLRRQCDHGAIRIATATRVLRPLAPQRCWECTVTNLGGRSL